MMVYFVGFRKELTQTKVNTHFHDLNRIVCRLLTEEDCKAMRRIKTLKMRIFPRKNGTDCGNAAIFFWFSFRTNKIFCPKIKTIILLQDNLLFSYYHTEIFKWHIFARAGNFLVTFVSNTVAHVFFFFS
jgi:hypothetical protein